MKGKNTIIFLSAIVILSFFCSLLRARQDDEIVLDRQISLSFETNGYKFYQGYPGKIGEPREAFLKLVAVKDKKQVILPSSNSLKGYVALKTHSDALEFVRLFTSIDTHYLFEGTHFIEVKDAGYDDPMKLRDDGHGGLLQGGGLSYGELTNKKFKELGLFEPKVQKVQNGFIIERCLVNYERDIIHSLETVRSDGEYSIKIKKIIAAKVGISLPIYE
ncbi:MAG: hypothetical protein A3H41_01645 [Omnitrophica WOR_2 bacterium RIFCSPLOWO2_02_FULL_45_28]|nr:MAG: hypothetical protein A3H41_01645 [Omnitrophica WOR_2 bacterium RIFCSPLOWO2_02_FULL_45_28]